MDPAGLLSASGLICPPQVLSTLGLRERHASGDL
jgi:hypothetical protein